MNSSLFIQLFSNIILIVLFLFFLRHFGRWPVSVHPVSSTYTHTHHAYSHHRTETDPITRYATSDRVKPSLPRPNPSRTLRAGRSSSAYVYGGRSPRTLHSYYIIIVRKYDGCAYILMAADDSCARPSELRVPGERFVRQIVNKSTTHTHTHSFGPLMCTIRVFWVPQLNKNVSNSSSVSISVRLKMIAFYETMHSTKMRKRSIIIAYWGGQLPSLPPSHKTRLFT